MSLPKILPHIPSVRSLGLSILGGALAVGCATASSMDGDKPAGGGDASIGGRVDGSVGIRPDAGPEEVSIDSGPVDAAQDPADADPLCVSTTINLLANGNFDLGPGSWVETSGGTPTPFALIVPDSDIGGVTADSGTFLTWLGGYSKAGAIDKFHQDFSIPADATPISLTGKIWIDSAEAPILAWDTLTLELVNVTTGAVLEEVGVWSNLDMGTGWTNLAESVTGNYAGQTVRLRFTASMDSTNNTSFLLDTLALNTTSCQ